MFWALLASCDRIEATTDKATDKIAETTPTAGSTTTTSTQTTPAGCVPDALPESWASLVLYTLSPLELIPGAEHEAKVYALGTEGPFTFAALALCETLRVEPADAGVSIEDGWLVVDPATPDGTEVTLIASISGEAVPELGDVEISLPVFVYDPALRPWVGRWSEVAQIDCGTGDERAPEEPLEEVWFWAVGYASVTWRPFEIYKDYWGRHAFEPDDLGPEMGHLALSIEGGNYVPPDVDSEGSYRIEGEDLVLSDVWLGTPREGTQPAACGHRLR